MKLCIDYLREIEQAKGWSRFRISKELGMSSQRVYQLFDEGGTYNDETAVKVAGILGIDAGMVVAAAHMEREKSPAVQAVWKGILEKISVGFEWLLSGAGPCGIRVSAS